MTELLLNQTFLTAFLVAALAAALPLALAAVGETVGEQSGVLNLGIEGYMLFGAYAAFSVTLASDNFWLGMLAGAASGVIASAAMAILGVVLGLNQIVTGLAVTLIGEGVTSVLYLRNYADSSPGLGKADAVPIPLLSEIPALGTALFAQPGIFWFCVLFIVAVAWFLRHSNWGLALRAAGQNPVALDAAGGSVVRVRLQAVILGGLAAGLGGASLALLGAGSFTPFMTGGLGFLAIVMTMLARGRILVVVLLSLGYGLLIASGTALQLLGVSVPADLITMLPFIVVMVVLVAVPRRAATVAALAVPYTRGAR